MIKGYSDWIEEQADLLFNNIAGWEQSTLQRIGKRIGKYGKMSVADIKAINNIAVVKQDMNEIVKELAHITGQNIAEIHNIYSQAIAKMHEGNRPLYDYRGKEFIPFEDNRELQALVRAYAKSTGETMINLSKTIMLGFTDRNGRFSHLARTYTNVLDKAVMAVATGATDFHTAMRDSIVELGGSGLKVSYGSGVTRRLDSVVRQNLLWGAKQASVEYNEMIGEELGCDGIEVDWHSNPRPSHEFMQGKQYSLFGEKVINGVTFEDATPALLALEDYGCLHYKVSIICGISEPRYSASELKRLNAQNERIYDIGGKKLTSYECTQAMRKLERAVRSQKSIRETARASGDKALVNRCNERIKAYKTKYSEISNITGIPEEPKRMSIVRMPKTSNNSPINLTNLGNGGIIKLSNVSTGGKRNETPLTKEQLEENINYAQRLGMPKEKIRYGDHYSTAYGSEFDMLYIGTDVYPSTSNAVSRNCKVSNKGAIAHEIVGHREAFLKGWEQKDIILDEIQASIRAAKFAPELTDTERFILMLDAVERARNFGYRMRDIQSHLNIFER